MIPVQSRVYNVLKILLREIMWWTFKRRYARSLYKQKLLAPSHVSVPILEDSSSDRDMEPLGGIKRSNCETSGNKTE